MSYIKTGCQTRKYPRKTRLTHNSDQLFWTDIDKAIKKHNIYYKYSTKNSKAKVYIHASFIHIYSDFHQERIFWMSWTRCETRIFWFTLTTWYNVCLFARTANMMVCTMVGMQRFFQTASITACGKTSRLPFCVRC